MLILPKKISYNVPKNDYGAFLKDVVEFEKAIKNKQETITRLLFQVTTLTAPRLVFMVGKNYRPGKAEVLAEDLESWIGPDRLDALLNHDGGLSLESLQTLIGEPADIRVDHIDNDEFENPFCHLKGIRPRGYWVPIEPGKEAA